MRDIHCREETKSSQCERTVFGRDFLPPPQRKCPFTAYTSVVCHHILSPPALSLDAQRRSARRCCDFGVKSSGEEARLSILCNQRERTICPGTRSLKRRLAA